MGLILSRARARGWPFTMAAGVVSSMISVGAVHAGSSTFAALAGSWSGSGTIALADGSKERIRCKAGYRTSDAGTRMQQSLRCASDSYRFELASEVTSESGVVAGSWSEATRGVGGSLVGKDVGGNITAVVDAPGFTANLRIGTHGNRHTFALSSQGDIREVSMNMTR